MSAHPERRDAIGPGPRIAVLIPVYNAPERLLATLRSLDAQAANFDIYVVDDGSDPPVAIDPGAYRHPVLLRRLPVNAGIVAALNAGLREILAKPYDYVARQDAGDLDLGERIAEQARFLDAHPEVALLGAWVEFADAAERGRYVYQVPSEAGEIRRRMRLSPCFIHPACMMRAAALREVGLYSEAYPCAEDYDLFVRLLAAHAGTNLPKVLVRSELNPDGISAGRRRRSLLSRLRLQIREFSPASFWAYYGIVRTLALLAIPYRPVLWLKARVKNVR